MKYLINETLCEKVEMGGFDYYVVDGYIKHLEYYLVLNESNTPIRKCNNTSQINYFNSRKIIATNNSSLDLPQVVNEVEGLATIDTEECGYIEYQTKYQYHIEGFIGGYNKAKETFEYTKEDMVEFTEWLITKSFREGTSDYTTKELLDIWNEQRIIKLNTK